MKKRFFMALACAAMMLPAAAQWTPGDNAMTPIDSVAQLKTMDYYNPVIINKADGSSLVAYKSRGIHTNPETGHKDAKTFYYLHFQKLDKDGNKVFPDRGRIISHKPTLESSFSKVHMDTMSNGHVVFSFADRRNTAESNFPGAGLTAVAYCYTQDGEPVWSEDGVKMPTYKHDSVVLGRSNFAEQIAASGENVYFGTLVIEQVNEWVDTSYLGMYHYYFELVSMDKDGNILNQRVDSAYPAFNYAFIPAPNGDIYYLRVREDEGYDAELLGPDLKNKWSEVVRVEDLGVTRHAGSLQQSYTPDEIVPMSDGSVAMVYPAYTDNSRSRLVYNRLYPDGHILGHVFLSDTLGANTSHACIFDGDTLTVFASHIHEIDPDESEYYMYFNSVKLDGTLLHPETPYGYWLSKSTNVAPNIIGAVKAGDNYHVLVNEHDVLYFTYNKYCYTVTPDGKNVGRKPILDDFEMPDRAFFSDGKLGNMLFTKGEFGMEGLWQASIDVTDYTNTKPVTSELNGKFTVNADGKQVIFSQSNVQFWNHVSAIQFGSKQWENANARNKWVTDPKVIYWYDHFGWGTGDDWTKVSTDDADYATYTSWGEADLFNGGYEPGTWRAMSADEWDYILSKRENAADKWALGQIYVGAATYPVRGLIILPDEFELPDTLQVHTGTGDFSVNYYYAWEWKRLEANGAVFLPLDAYREGIDIHGYDSSKSSGSEGLYWTPTTDGDTQAKALHFDKNGWVTQSYPRSYGMSVRLVKDAEGEQGVEDIRMTDDNKTRKFFMNGQLFIEKNGKMFNATGVQVR